MLQAQKKTIQIGIRVLACRAGHLHVGSTSAEPGLRVTCAFRTLDALLRPRLKQKYIVVKKCEFEEKENSKNKCERFKKNPKNHLSCKEMLARCKMNVNRYTNNYKKCGGRPQTLKAW